MPNHFVEHLMGTVAVNVQKFSKQFQWTLSFSSELVVDLDSAAVAPCSLSPPPYPLRRTIAWRLAGVGDEQEEVRHP